MKRVSLIQEEKEMKILVNGMIILSLAVLALMTACSSMKIATDYSEETDFKQFSTFKYVDSDQNLAATYNLQHQRVVEAIKQEMVSEGYSEVATNPDVFVTYFAGIDKQVILHSTGMAHGRGRGWHGGTMMATSTTSSQTIKTGIIDIDIWDAGADLLVWRGQVSDALSGNPDKTADSIKRGVNKVFKEYPPK